MTAVHQAHTGMLTAIVDIRAAHYRELAASIRNVRYPSSNLLAVERSARARLREAVIMAEANGARLSP